MMTNYPVIKGCEDNGISTEMLTKDVNEISVGDIHHDPAFAVEVFEEAISVFVNGEPDVARLMLRNLVNATVGFEALAAKTGKPSKSIHRMLSAKGNPTMDNLSAIISVLRDQLKVKEFSVTVNIVEPASIAESTETEEFHEQLKSA